MVVKQCTVVVTKLRIYQRGIEVGWGTLARRGDGQTMVGDFYGFDGERLVDDWYDIVPTTEQWIETAAKKVM